MIRTRVVVGVLLALGAGGVLVGDTQLAQRGYAWFPCLFAFLLFAGVACSRELLQLFPPIFRPPEPLVIVSVLLLIAANWYPLVHAQFSSTPATPWGVLVGVFVGVILATFLLEMRRYGGEPGAALPRIAFT